MKQTKPIKVTIGGIEYKIWFERDFGDNLFGRTNQMGQEILVNKDVSEERQRATLLHELIHAISFELMDEKAFLTEQQVNSLAQELYRILKDDKKITRFLLPSL